MLEKGKGFFLWWSVLVEGFNMLQHAALKTSNFNIVQKHTSSTCVSDSEISFRCYRASELNFGEKNRERVVNVCLHLLFVFFPQFLPLIRLVRDEVQGRVQNTRYVILVTAEGKEKKRYLF